MASFASDIFMSDSLYGGRKIHEGEEKKEASSLCGNLQRPLNSPPYRTFVLRHLAIFYFKCALHVNEDSTLFYTNPYINIVFTAAQIKVTFTEHSLAISTSVRHH